MDPNFSIEEGGDQDTSGYIATQQELDDDIVGVGYDSGRDLLSHIAASSTTRRKRDSSAIAANDDDGMSSGIGQAETNLVQKTFAWMTLYIGMVLFTTWLFYRIGIHGFLGATIAFGTISFVLIMVLCAFKKKEGYNTAILLCFLTSFLLFLSYFTVSCHCDVVPRTAFVLMISYVLTVTYATLVPSMSLHVVTLLNLLWAVTGHTLLAASSPDVALRMSIELTVVEFTLSLILICYSLIQIRYIHRWVRGSSVIQVIIYYCIDIPIVVLNRALSKCSLCASGQ